MALSSSLLQVVAIDADIVEVSTWKDDHRGALSFSVDDNSMACAAALALNGFKGSYFAITWDSAKRRLLGFPDMAVLRVLGHEIGAHTKNHTAWPVEADHMRKEFSDNIDEIAEKIGVPARDIITMAWPSGNVQHQDIAAEYFLAARGYNINELEEQTPTNFMNLKSFNSHMHTPFPPNDLKVVLDQAQQQGKWAILAFHLRCDDDGAIGYARGKDLWVAPIGTVIKYILQRNRAEISGLQREPSMLKFEVSRAEVSPSRIRSFESAFGVEDEITLKIDVDDSRKIDSIKIDNRRASYKARTWDDNLYILLNTPLPASAKKAIEIVYSE